MPSLALFPRLHIRCMKKAPKTALCAKETKKRTGDLSVSGFFWSKWWDSSAASIGAASPAGVTACFG